jgi:hypothetical protein
MTRMIEMIPTHCRGKPIQVLFEPMRFRAKTEGSTVLADAKESPYPEQGIDYVACAQREGKSFDNLTIAVSLVAARRRSCR